MSYVTENQPDGTPTWIDLGIPDLDRAMDFYRAVFGWEFEVGPPEAGRYTICRLGGRTVAGLAETGDNPAGFWWNMYLATSDCAATVSRVGDAGGSVVVAATDVMDFGRSAMVKDPVGAQFGLWQGGTLVGCEVVNEPGALLRNDLITPDPGPAREFYSAVFDFTLDGNEDLPNVDFTFLRRPDGHEIGGIMGVQQATSSAWDTLFQVSDTDEAVSRAAAAGGTSGEPEDMIYGRIAQITDPFGTKFSVGSSPAGDSF